MTAPRRLQLSFLSLLIFFVLRCFSWWWLCILCFRNRWWLCCNSKIMWVLSPCLKKTVVVSCNSCCSFLRSQPSLTFQKRCVQKKFIKLILFTFLHFKCIETHLLLIKSQINTAFHLYLLEIYLKTLLPQVTLWL